jgi:chemotaxis protein methyltransferase CheR
VSALASADAGYPLPDQDYERFAAFLHERVGIDLFQYKRRQMERRIRSRALRTGCGDLDTYQLVVDRSGSERDALLAHITINVSQLFRNPEQWERIARSVIPDLAGRGAIRAWSAGCSFGAEAYSLAATVADVAPQVQLEVDATDIDRRILEAGGRGEFTAEDARAADPGMLERRFEPLPDGGWRAGRPLMDAVTFAQQDLLATTSRPGRYDLILCRNVVIYLTPEARSLVHELLASSLRPGGYLVIGSTERIALPLPGLGLEQVHPFIFRRCDAAGAR